MTRELSEQGKTFIKDRESCSLVPHWDAIGKVWDIGYGHVFKAGEPRVPITQDEADALFDTDVLYRCDIVEHAVIVELLQEQFDALVSFVYNVGGTAFTGSKVLTYVNGGMHDVACLEMLTWRKSGGKKIDGLLNRRAKEVLIYKYGDYD
jgi:lysozyme